MKYKAMMFENIAVGLLIPYLLLLGSVTTNFVYPQARVQNGRDKLNKMSLAEIEIEGMANALCDNYKAEDVRQLGGLVADINEPYEIRLKSLKVLSYCYNKGETYEMLVKYINTALPELDLGTIDKMVDPVLIAMTKLYRQTDEEKWLLALREAFKSKGCDKLCRLNVMQVLMETTAKSNIPFYLSIVDDASNTEEVRAGAAYGLAKSGSDKSVKYLNAMINYLFDTEPIRGHLAYYMYATLGLKSLAESGNRAAGQIIGEVVERLCGCDKRQHALIENNSGNLFDAVAEIGGRESKEFMEKVSREVCINPSVNERAIDVLGKIGDESTIPKLQNLYDRFPAQVSKAINEIERRRGNGSTR